MVRFNFCKAHQNVGKWVNVNAVGSGISGGDFVTFLGRSWDNNPRAFADEHILAPFNHEYFLDMMNFQAEGNKSPQSILNE